MEMEVAMQIMWGVSTNIYGLLVQEKKNPWVAVSPGKLLKDLF
jgi:hypothetical protein